MLNLSVKSDFLRPPWTIAHQAPLSMGFSRTILDSSSGQFSRRILEWVAISSSKGSSPPRDRTCVSYIFYFGRHILYH